VTAVTTLKKTDQLGTRDETFLEKQTSRIYFPMKTNNECPCCGKAMIRVIDLPRYPLTEHYEEFSEKFTPNRGYVDQSFLFCMKCSHAKLETIVPADMLYGKDYRTKTATSVGSVRAVDNFAAFIKETDLERIQTVIDIGGNDGTLIAQFPMQERVIVDPNAKGPYSRYLSYIEDAELEAWKADRKLIVSSHTLEHVEDPHTFLSKVSAVMNAEDLLAIQVPSLELMCEDARFDQVNHQHIHYFSLHSLSDLLGKYGLEVKRFKYDPDHYGAVMVMAWKGGNTNMGSAVQLHQVEWGYKVFKASMNACNLSLLWRDQPIAYGASLALPVLSYHLPHLGNVEFIADDDQGKAGLRYINFNKEIRYGYDLKDMDVVITAVSTKLACRRMVENAMRQQAKNVIVPIHNL